MKSNLLFSLSFIFFTLNTYNVFWSQKFKIEIIQDDQIIEVIDEVVELEKKEFQIRFTLKKQDGVFMNASFQKDYFKLQSNDAIKDYEYIRGKTMAEIEFNGDKELYMHDEYFTYLFFNKNKDWHRFDKGVVTKGKTVIGTKTVEKTWNVHDKKTTQLEDLKNDIYLFFVAQDYRNNEEVPDELGRYKIHIIWK